jgi:hypothetical protein
MAVLLTSWTAVNPFGRYGCILEVIERITEHVQDTARQQKKHSFLSIFWRFLGDRESIDSTWTR